MGCVYKARQLGPNRLVALKIITPGRQVASKDLIRFLAEAEAVAAVKHPHVVQVFEYGEADGLPFLAMEYLPGGSLADRIKAGKLDPTAAAAMVARIARGVQAAHDQGIVHRDLKPANVLLDEAGEPKVTDFGLAERAKGADLTQTRAVMGTPAYMSPEQAGGKSKFVGPESDVYAPGVILYECLAGTRPFQHDDPTVLLALVQLDDPTPPSRRVPGLPRELELIALKCPAKEPAERHATAGELADDLDRFVAGEPVSVHAPSTVERAVKWARRKPTLAASYVLGLAVVALVTFGASVAVLRRKAETARAAAVVAQKGAELARTGEEKERKAAESARDAEKVARAEVEAARKKLEGVEYGRTIQVAYQEWRDNNINTTLALLAGADRKLRGWEWRYANHLCHDELLRINKRNVTIASASWSPDGSRIATAGADNTARIWDARTRAEGLAASGH